MKLCCDLASKIIHGKTGNWFIGNETLIKFCPFCGTKLPEQNIGKFEVVVRYDRGLGAEFKKVEIKAFSLNEAKGKAEKEVSESIEGKFQILGSQATLIK